MAHVTERHSAREQRRGILPGLLSLPGNVVGGVVSENLGALINAPIDRVGGAWLSHYSRGQEMDADRIGMRTAARAGYDPAALGGILARLERDVASQTGEERRFSMFDSHPMTETRLHDIQRNAASLRPAATPPIAGDTATLLGKLDGLWWGENPEAGVFRKNQFLQPTAGFTITFPDGWKHQNTPQYVISAQPSQEAVLLLGIASPASDPQVKAQTFIDQMRTRARIEPFSARATSLGEFPAYVVTYLDRSGRTSAYLHFAWVTMAGRTYHLIGMASENRREALKNAALTLRPMTEVERGSITGKRLRIVAARQGERLEDLDARSGNVWSPAYTALVNGLEAEAALKDGQLVKIARLEPVRPQAPPSSLK
jgi:predicted Zn-dependent protease